MFKRRDQINVIYITPYPNPFSHVWYLVYKGISYPLNLHRFKVGYIFTPDWKNMFNYVFNVKSKDLLVLSFLNHYINVMAQCCNNIHHPQFYLLGFNILHVPCDFIKLNQALRYILVLGFITGQEKPVIYKCISVVMRYQHTKIHRIVWFSPNYVYFIMTFLFILL